MSIRKIPHVTLIMDLQFGSTGKGLIAGYLAERDAPDTLVTAWAANAGHTYINSAGRKFVHTMLANGIVSPNLKQILVGPGSIIDPVNFAREIEDCWDLLTRGVLTDKATTIPIFIHENAAVITQRHRDEEAGPMTKIGSTKKGCGAAAIQRIRRNPDDLNTVRAAKEGKLGELFELFQLRNVHVVTPNQYATILDAADKVQIEGAQGYSLSMYHGFYPYTTSRDVSTAQVFADCGIPFSWAAGANIVGTVRTYPIRVANRFDEAGNQIGWSGPSYQDQVETSFETLGQDIELTTVTKLPRRIFTFSLTQIEEAVRLNGVTEIFLNFCNYIQEHTKLMKLVEQINEFAPVAYLGHGPTRDDVQDVTILA